jgi:hypothetical protein
VSTAPRGPSIVDITPVLREAVAIAIADHHAHVGSEHLAILALDGPDGINAMAREAGLDPSSLPMTLRSNCNETAGAGDPEPRATPRTARMLSVAAQRAAMDGAEAISPIHLASSLLDELGAVAWHGLGAVNVTPIVLLDGIERRDGTNGSLIPAPSSAGARYLLHELNNLLVAWMGYAEFLERSDDDPELDAESFRAAIVRIQVAVRRVTAVGFRLGYFSFDEFSALTGEDAPAAQAGFRQAGQRWLGGVTPMSF